MDIAKEKLGRADDSNGDHPAGLRGTFKRIVSRNKADKSAEKDKTSSQTYTQQYVSDHVLRQILLGESLIEIVYPDISIDTDNEFCPRCNYYLSDDDVVAGWSAGNSQEYKTECPNSFVYKSSFRIFVSKVHYPALLGHVDHLQPCSVNVYHHGC